jgi:hypothetical protein
MSSINCSSVGAASCDKSSGSSFDTSLISSGSSTVLGSLSVDDAIEAAVEDATKCFFFEASRPIILHEEIYEYAFLPIWERYQPIHFVFIEGPRSVGRSTLIKKTEIHFKLRTRGD